MNVNKVVHNRRKTEGVKEEETEIDSPREEVNEGAVEVGRHGRKWRREGSFK